MPQGWRSRCFLNEESGFGVATAKIAKFPFTTKSFFCCFLSISLESLAHAAEGAGRTVTAAIEEACLERK